MGGEGRGKEQETDRLAETGTKEREGEVKRREKDKTGDRERDTEENRVEREQIAVREGERRQG